MVAKLEPVLEMACTVLDSLSNATVIPDTILKGCKGVALISSMEIAFVISGGGGDGVVVKRNDDGSWGAPAAISMNFVGVGFNFGIGEKYVLLFPMTEQSLKALTDDTYKAGIGAGIAAGPIGREADVSVEAGGGGAGATFSYAIEKGAIITVGISGSKINQCKEANKEFYGSDASPTEIVMNPGAVTIPKGSLVEALHKKLDELTKK